VLSARLYDMAMSRAERGALGTWRRELLASAHGNVLEVGAGTGANLPHYPCDLRSLTLVEPDRQMRSRLAARSTDGLARVIEGRAEALPVPDASVDAVVATLVLCTVPDVPAGLAEIQRVLRPGGVLLLIEHVAAPEPSTTLRAQRLLNPLWGRVAGGCHLDRDSRSSLESAGFDTAGVQDDLLPIPLPVLRPVLRGTARSR
jgi:ubiquinone/menaquinone biosynthesis C-methylase UbiE